MRSSLEIWDVARDQARVILQSDQHIEAPNFTADGRALVVNMAGHLYHVPLDHPRLQLIDTAGQDRINNDHALSPDGKFLAFCDKSLTGHTAIFVMPMQGAQSAGVPRRITQNLPSWFHGWSPDSKCLIYAGVREGQFAILSSDLSGVEKILVQGAGHYDGPEITADGQWIWFNSNRSDVMALWRMRPDGSDLQQMTSGTQDDWFPHPSPDGLHICYLAYDQGTEGHPFGVDVDLCLMPADGGEARVLQRIHGGQGCLNSPCWAPDGACFAYVRYISE